MGGMAGVALGVAGWCTLVAVLVGFLGCIEGEFVGVLG